MDSETAAIMLAQLSADEATPLRTAMRELGPLDPEEQSDVIAEFRRSQPAAAATSRGVELEFSADAHGSAYNAMRDQSVSTGSSKRFEILDKAPTSALVPYLSREHAQTIAVVLAHLAPDRAAEVLSALPEKLQSETVERLSALGETDPESVTALERELAAWMATRRENRGALAKRRETVANILAAADPKIRRGIINKLRLHNEALADQFESHVAPATSDIAKPAASARTYESRQAAETTARIRRQLAPPTMPSPQAASSPVVAAARLAPSAPAVPRIEFDRLIHLDSQGLTALIRSVDPQVLAIALAGSQDELVDRVCDQMPKRVGRAFRRELRKLGPIRLSDMETAQRTVADAAARYLARRRESMAAST
jgi:flagellar motor switch protein FliG